ncbi:MAG: hypothetical protein ACREJC_03825 [Tepidisphaeraceae bacterium]
MRERVTTETLYQYDELSEDAQEKARDWYRQGDDSFNEYHAETVIDDCKEALKLAGFDVERIYYSGFCSQGDGACFEGTWKPDSLRGVEEFAAEYPASYTDKDGAVHQCQGNEALQAINRESNRLAALDPKRQVWWRVKHRGHYYHEQCVEFSHEDLRETHCQEGECQFDAYCECACEPCNARPESIEADHEENARDAMRWVYRQLEREYEYQNADEQVADTIRANEYEFDADGHCR